MFTKLNMNSTQFSRHKYIFKFKFNEVNANKFFIIFIVLKWI